MTRKWIAMSAVLLAGCATHPPAGTGEDLRGSSSHSSMFVRGGGSIASAPKSDGAHRVLPVVIALDVYHLTVPQGAISRNDEFWKRVDEDRVDVGTHDLLFKNGIRIGLGRDADWPYFKGLLGKYPSARSARGRTQLGKEGYIELLMRGNVLDQNIFGIDDQDNIWGRRFEKCDDLLGISFIASPHSPGEAIVKVCPIVRGIRRFFRVTIFNEENQIDLTQPEHLYDLRLESHIPLNDFLIVAPSKQAQLSTSLGDTFLETDGNAEPIEHVLVIVPRAYRTEDPPTPDAK